MLLYGDLEEEVYMEQLPSFVAHGVSSSFVCRLGRSNLLSEIVFSSLVWEVRYSNSGV